ncbi:ABC-2 family transporter protein [Candidatus Acetothermia bacterium]|nr:ABC-2 family transporter protein [Candidatus Acetothermia bacterium]
MRYLKLWVFFLKNCLLREMEFRGNFVIEIGGNLLRLGITILFFQVIFLHTPTIGGWDIHITLLLVAVNQLINNLYNAFFRANIYQISEYVREGTLDFILVKPIDPQFFTTLRYVSFSALFSLVFPLLIIFYLATAGKITFSLPIFSLFLLLLLCGVAIRYAIGVAVMTLSFWVTEAYALHGLYSEFFSLSGYPAVIFRGGWQFFFTFIIPIIVVANFPVMAVTQVLSPAAVLFAVGLSALLLLITRKFFHFALRNYCSASS